MLRLGSRYNEEEDIIQFSNGVSLTRDQLEAGGFGSLTDTIFRFSRSLAQMDVDQTEFALLSAICLISGGKWQIGKISSVKLISVRIDISAYHV